MPTNDFLPYAGAGGANVEAQATYAADPQTSNGQQTGIADSKNANKAWRQATAIASALAQVVVNVLGLDMLDNGNQADKITKITNAITGLAWLNAIFTGTVNGAGASSFTVPTVAGTSDSSTKAASTGFVQAVRALLAPLASPALTGTPTVPTAAPGTNTTQAASTAFVQAALAGKPSLFTTTGWSAIAGSTASIAHGLASQPIVLGFSLTCVNPEHGYSAGRSAIIAALGDSANMGIAIDADATTLYWKVGSGSGGEAFAAIDGSTGATVHLTGANWSLNIWAMG